MDADLAGGVIKQRIARPGQGKSGGDRANIDTEEQNEFEQAARHVLGLTEKQIAELVKNRDFVEVKEDEQEIPK